MFKLHPGRVLPEGHTSGRRQTCDLRQTSVTGAAVTVQNVLPWRHAQDHPPNRRIWPAVRGTGICEGGLHQASAHAFVLMSRKRKTDYNS